MSPRVPTPSVDHTVIEAESDDAPRWGAAEATLLAINLVPLVGLLTGWTALQVMLAYWLECVIVILFTMAKAALAFDPGPGLGRTRTCVERAFTMAIGLALFGAMMFVYGGAILGMFGGPDAVELASRPDRSLARFLADAVTQPWAWALVAGHAVEFALERTRTGNFRDVPFGQLVMSPLRRTVPIHVVLMAGALPVMLLGAPTLGVVLLVVAKTWIDVRYLRRAQGRLPASGALW